MAKRSHWTLCLGLVSGLFAAHPVLAQSAPPPALQAAPTVPSESADVKSAQVQQTEPTFQIFGIVIGNGGNIGLSAPVPPPYEATWSNDLAGQPMNSVDQVMSQQFTGQEP
jgi:hypothetical protein